MSFAIKTGQPIPSELRRLARKQLAQSSERLLKKHAHDEDVHEGRKSIKKVEAIAGLLDALGSKRAHKDVKRLRGEKRVLSRLRDAVAVLDTFDQMRSRFSRRIPQQTAALIRSRLSARKTRLMGRSQSARGTAARAGKALAKLRRTAKRWTAPSTDLSDLPRALRKSYRSSRKAMMRAMATGQAADFHEWRKRVKTLWYQLRLVERLARRLSPEIEAFKALETALGDEHNLAVLRTVLQHDRALRRITSQMVDIAAMSVALQDEARRTAIVLGTRLYALSPRKWEKDLTRAQFR